MVEIEEKLIDFGKAGTARVTITRQTDRSSEEVEHNRQSQRQAVENMYSKMFGGNWVCVANFNNRLYKDNI